PRLATLRLEPPMAEVTAKPGMPAMQPYQAFGTIDGHEEDVTNRVLWSVDRPLLVPAIPAGVATTGDRAGGMVQIKAVSGSVSGTAKLLIKFSAINVADGPGA